MTPAQNNSQLREALAESMETLRHNREKVPIQILKTTYKKGYDALCRNIRRYASDYAKDLTLTGIRIHQDYLDEGLRRIRKILEDTGALAQLSRDIFQELDLDAFERHCTQLRQVILEEMERFYQEHPGLYFPEGCLRNPDILPVIFCPVSQCVLIGDRWMPLEEWKEQTTKQALSA